MAQTISNEEYIWNCIKKDMISWSKIYLETPLKEEDFKVSHGPRGDFSGFLAVELDNDGGLRLECDRYSKSFKVVCDYAARDKDFPQLFSDWGIDWEFHKDDSNVVMYGGEYPQTMIDALENNIETLFEDLHHYRTEGLDHVIFAWNFIGDGFKNLN